MEPSLDEARQERARDYAATGRRLSLCRLVLGVAFLVVLLLTPLSLMLRDLLDFPQPLRVALYFAVVVLCLGILSSPLSFYQGYVLPRRFGLSLQGLKGWLVDTAKGVTLGLLLGMAAMVLVYWLLGSFPQVWWLLSALFLILFTVVMTHLAPIVIVPLFYRLQPLADSDLSERLLRLAQRAGTRVQGVFTMELSSKATVGNAALMGLGNTRRIVLGDTMLKGYSAEEIEVIMAHELGHHVQRHIAKLIAFQSVVALLGFYVGHLALSSAVYRLGFYGLGDVAAFPLLALALGGFGLVMAPLANAYSRRLEAVADQYALALTDNPRGFTAAMTRLANQNLSEARPSRWVELLFHDHPPYWRRVDRARRYERRRGGEG